MVEGHDGVDGVCQGRDGVLLEHQLGCHCTKNQQVNAKLQTRANSRALECKGEQSRSVIMTGCSTAGASIPSWMKA